MQETQLTKLNKKAVALRSSGLLRHGYQPAVAKKCGVDKMTILRVMQGKYKQSTETVEKVLFAILEDAREHMKETASNCKQVIDIINK